MNKGLRRSKKPLICSFYNLAMALQSVHLWNKADVDRLHDVWLMGAPTPDSRILDPKGFDERKVQRGNTVKRIVFRKPLAEWIRDTATRRGLRATTQEAFLAVELVSKAWS